MPPEAQILPLTIYFQFAPPFLNNLEIDCLCGCSDSPSFKFEIKNDAESIGRIYRHFIEKGKNDLLTEQDRQEFVTDILNLKENEKA